jgi:hypothetical protein
VGRGPIGAVVGLQVSPGGTPFDCIGRIEPLEGGLLMGVRSTPDMGDASDGVRLGEYGADEHISGLQEVLHDGNGDRSVAHQLAGLAGCGDTTKPSVVVNS